MGTEEKTFTEMPESEQNRLLQKLAGQLRPMLGEIGEVFVKPSPPDNLRPGFFGILFEHGAQVILFAEYVEQAVRSAHRDRETPSPHIFRGDDLYVSRLRAAGKGRRVLGSDSLRLADLRDDIGEAFQGYYGAEAKRPEFRIKLQAMGLFKSEVNRAEAMLYFASKQDDECTLNDDIVPMLSKLVEQLIRSALGLAIISDHELRSVASYLAAKLPQSFDDYVMPQTLAAIYAYVREVVPLPLPNPPIPRVTGCEDEELKKRLESIHSATNVEVVRAVGGSLKGAPVYSLRITTQGHRIGSSTQYPAIAKLSTIGEARAEADGLHRMQRYYSHIGKMLPPPLEVYLIKDGARPKLDATDWLQTSCVSVTPDLEGRPLSEIIAQHWSSPTMRVERFSALLSQAKEFVAAIQRQPLYLLADEVNGASAFDRKHDVTANDAPQNRLIDFFCRASAVEKRRYQLMIDGVALGALDLLLTVKGCKACTLVNPLAWLRLLLDDSTMVKWKHYPDRASRIVLIHGDFHTGNLFYTTGSDQLVVLDYDRVGGGPAEEDCARLEASFVASVFGLPDFYREDNWKRYAPNALSLLAGCHPYRIEMLETNPFARDLAETLATIRPSSDISPFYAASVVIGCLIQLKTTYTKRRNNEHSLVSRHGLEGQRGRTLALWLYAGLMLTHLIDVASEPTSWDAPWPSALPTK
jgi:hypothetical protein